MSATDPSKPPTDAPGSRDSELPWRPVHSEPQQHDQPKYRPPAVEHDIPGGVPGGEPSTGWGTTE